MIYVSRETFMVKIISINNQKGGVGKTTTAINFSASLAAIGYNILLIDFDPQGNTSSGISIKHKKHNIYTYITKKCNFKEVVQKSFIPGLSVLPSSIHLAAAEIEFSTIDKREYILKDVLEKEKKIFDYIIIDCPPSFGLLSLNALVAADSVLIPLQCEYYALSGLVALLDNISRIKKIYNKNLTIEGIILTMYDKRSALAKQIEDDVRQNLKSKVFKTVIPRNVKIAEAPSHGKPIMFYDLKCSGSIAYLELVKEFLEKK
ncbi:MAG: ParA family protein [Holosporales bacterium]|jgi:chromosome partitioning protein|nr:ParA family protein [Holosporales bacterium]